MNPNLFKGSSIYDAGVWLWLTIYNQNYVTNLVFFFAWTARIS